MCGLTVCELTVCLVGVGRGWFGNEVLHVCLSCFGGSTFASCLVLRLGGEEWDGRGVLGSRYVVGSLGLVKKMRWDGGNLRATALSKAAQ